jgi:hypothetical protein
MFVLFAVVALPWAVSLPVQWLVIRSDGKVSRWIPFICGFASGVGAWSLFCISEWQSSYGFKEVLYCGAGASFVGGLIGAVNILLSWCFWRVVGRKTRRSQKPHIQEPR